MVRDLCSFILDGCFYLAQQLISLREGVVKTYKLTYESKEIMRALFDKNVAKNTWTIAANVLRDFIEYFGPKTEQLDIYSDNGRATFTSYREKIMDDKGGI